MYLEKLNQVTSLKGFSEDELIELCAEIRTEIINAVNNNGGHLASNLGVVELTVALYYVFDFKTDRLIFDVGHQSYTHKILSGRLKDFNSIRKEGGLSGFPDINESEYDAFTVGHAGTSIAAGLGYAYSRDKLNQDYNIINVVGDASFVNGENLEAIIADVVKPKNFIVILNDNGMSINKNKNGLYKAISKITVKKRYYKINNYLSRTIGKTFFGRFLSRCKRAIKSFLNQFTILDSFGLKYIGCFNGHDLKSLIRLLTEIKESQIPTFLHVKTIKGKGLCSAENNADKFHGVGKNLCNNEHYFSSHVSEILEEVYLTENKITAITAGMKDGVGLTCFAERHKDAFVDVGIAEEYAVTLASGMAISGTKPIIFIYSTFLQRAYDQILSDVCLQNLPVIFCIDRAGLVGSDGKTHQGEFDISYLVNMPNMTVFAPKDVNELKQAMFVALKLNSPVAIRYPSGMHCDLQSNLPLDESLKWEVLSEGKKNTILAVGPRMIKLAFEVKEKSKKDIRIINARTIKPLDKDVLDEIYKDKIITLEENIVSGGFGTSVLKYYSDKGLCVDVKVCGIKDDFIGHATVDSQLKESGLTVLEIQNLLK